MTTSLSLKYSQPVGADGEWYVFTDWVYRGEVNFFLYDSVEFTGKSLTEGGLRIGYTWGHGRYDVAAFVKGRPDLSHIPVLLLAGAFEPVDDARAQQVKCDGVLVKPFSLSTMVNEIRRVLRLSHTRP